MSDKKKFFVENGYVVYKQLISQNQISQLLDCFKNFILKNGLYYSQSNHNWRKTIKDIDEFGLLEKSIEDFTNLFLEPKLSNAGRNILLSKEISSCLVEISGLNDDFCMWQNMFFDKSIGTVDHIDSWYLDTDPMGHLIGVWIALEDIDGRGGAFHVYPGSHKMKQLEWKNLTHNQFIEWSHKASKKFKKFSAYLKKGNVLFWHPSLLHGSSNQKAKSYSRKSLTAHYHPISFKRGGGGEKTDSNSKKYKKSIYDTMSKMKKYNDLPIYASDNLQVLKNSAKGLIKYFTGYKNYENSLMQRDAYNLKN